VRFWLEDKRRRPRYGWDGMRSPFGVEIGSAQFVGEADEAVPGGQQVGTGAVPGCGNGATDLLSGEGGAAVAVDTEAEADKALFQFGRTSSARRTAPTPPTCLKRERGRMKALRRRRPHAAMRHATRILNALRVGTAHAP
jgi:hypothetical protein